MALALSKRPNDHDFAVNKDLLVRLYTEEGGSLQHVMNHMKTQYGWEAKKNQYEKWLTGKWTVRKYVDSMIWRKIYPHVRQIERQGQQAEVWIDGVKKDPYHIHRELRRQVYKHPELASALPETLPKRCIVRAVAVAFSGSNWFDLPFHLLEAKLASQSRVFQGPWPRTENRNLEVGNNSKIVLSQPVGEIESLLRPVVLQGPPSQQNGCLSIMERKTQIFTSSLHRNILFSVANNFAGLEALSREEVIQFLQRETNETLYEMILSVPQYYVTQAIAMNLFRAAIDIGDTRTMTFLLDKNFPNIAINEFLYPYNGQRYTPIEVAAARGHLDMVKALIGHGADVNLTNIDDTPFLPRGAFECALQGLHGEFRKLADTVINIDQRLFELLLRAGGNLRSHALRELIQCDQTGQYTLPLMKAQFRQKHHEWKAEGIFLSIFKHQPHSVMSEVLNIIASPAMDGFLELVWGGSWPKTILDVTARRGSLTLVQKLLSMGFEPTYHTVACAISSGNEDLVDLLIQNGVNINEFVCSGSFRQSPYPLAAAISSQNTRMIELMGTLTTEETLSDTDVFLSVLYAAAEVGNLTWIQYLVCADVQERATHLGKGLIVAIAKGMQQAALNLIDGNTDVNIIMLYESEDTTALKEALKQQDHVLVKALLDAGASVTDNCFYATQDYENASALELAVSWGNVDVVEAIVGVQHITSPASTHYSCTRPLSVAIMKEDYRLIDILIKAGYNVNDPSAYILNGSALTAAVKTGRLDMVQHVFNLGADPHDPSALQVALDQSQDIVDLLLLKHQSRYPKGRTGWGSCVLTRAIESGDLPLFKKLINRKLDPKHCDRGTSPFGVAIRCCSAQGFAFVEYLLQETQITGCTPDTIVSTFQTRKVLGNKFLSKMTAFSAAIMAGIKPVVVLMLRHCADINRPALHGISFTPLQVAVVMGRIEIIELLLDHGADTNGLAARYYGATALQIAASKGYHPIARLLLERGADVDGPGAKVNGLSALEAAAEAGYLDMVTMLLKAGAASNGADKGHLQRANRFAEGNGQPHISNMLNDYEKYGRLSDAQREDIFDSTFDFAAYEQA